MTTFKVNHPSRLTGILIMYRRNKDNPLGFQQLPLSVRTPKGKARSQGTILEDNPMAWNHTRFGVGMKGESDKSGISGSPRQSRYLTIRGDPASRYAPDDLVDHLRKGLLSTHASIVRGQKDKTKCPNPLASIKGL